MTAAVTRLYLDNCCFNRPFDDQSQLRVRLETEAKLHIQGEVRAGSYQLVWSYLLDYENGRNPFRERREQIAKWRRYAIADVEASDELIAQADQLGRLGLRNLDALHIACALHGEASCFLTTDDGILKRADQIQGLLVLDPIAFIKETSP
ncbi:type II toxin-antitoxin system VapC family toxin [Thiohalocapsa marina]|uniref:Type II toxin-antitoxin system VapC family toxin n=1 Tax=Thiohalocapsa marina TaxID=424902 RepID=A0A5M8FB95_9GAMM|nr:PIN domain-containing protein [Thiohalocapsa marina]KAA6182148.1 type II toxin-antitoxin system VapC family toxin [Thiohalocapsa marina]